LLERTETTRMSGADTAIESARRIEISGMLEG